MGSLGQALLDSVIFKKDLPKSNRKIVRLSRVQDLAAVDHQCVAGDEGGFVGNQKQHAVGYFFRGAHAEQRFVAARHPGALFFRRVFIDGPARGKTAKARCLQWHRGKHSLLGSRGDRNPVPSRGLD